MKLTMLGLAIVALTGCVHKAPVLFDVETDPPGAMVEVSGVSQCETPCTITLKCRKHLVKGALEGENVTMVTVTPRRNPAGQQSRGVDPCTAADGKQKLYFNMNMDYREPVQRIEIKKR